MSDKPSDDEVTPGESGMAKIIQFPRTEGERSSRRWAVRAQRAMRATSATPEE